jgi:hypothetical protein
MPAEIVSAWFCADYWSEFVVTGSKLDIYRVHWYGSEGKPSCYNVTQNEPCKGMLNWGHCRHVDMTWKQGCFWNPQWYDGGTRQIKPVSRPQEAQRNLRHKIFCPKCRGPVVAVRIAV